MLEMILAFIVMFTMVFGGAIGCAVKFYINSKEKNVKTTRKNYYSSSGENIRERRAY